MTNNFQISYTLDVLFYIECMLNEEKRQLYDEEVARFMPMFGTVSDKYLDKLQKHYRQDPLIIRHLVAILVDNPHLHDWSVSDLLENHQSLISDFKQSTTSIAVPKAVKNFISTRYKKIMPLIKIIVNDLERLQFKKFWLEEKLPVLKETINLHTNLLAQHDVVSFTNQWLTTRKLPTTKQWYMLAYSGSQYDVLLAKYHVVSSVICATDLCERVVTYALQVNSYDKQVRVLKPTKALKAEFKTQQHLGVFKSVAAYREACLKMALKVHLLAGLNQEPQPLTDEYPLATKILLHLPEGQVGAITEMMKKLGADYYGK